MSKAEYMPSKYRLPRKGNTRWILYAIKQKRIHIMPTAGIILDRRGKPMKVYSNPFGYKYIRVQMHGTSFSFFVHKVIFLAEHGAIPRGKELDHVDGDLSNNMSSNIAAVTMRQNLKKRKYREVPTYAF